MHLNRSSLSSYPWEWDLRVMRKNGVLRLYANHSEEVERRKKKTIGWMHASGPDRSIHLRVCLFWFNGYGGRRAHRFGGFIISWFTCQKWHLVPWNYDEKSKCPQKSQCLKFNLFDPIHDSMPKAIKYPTTCFLFERWWRESPLAQSNSTSHTVKPAFWTFQASCCPQLHLYRSLSLSLSFSVWNTHKKKGEIKVADCCLMMKRRFYGYISQI
jgi:hypothetical protein